MKLVVPYYYNDFSCLMGRCRHSCCKGWEIDVDSESLEYYRSLPDSLRDWVLSNITQADDVPCFHMTEAGCCPFLNSDGLCDMILRLGKESLCDICSDHPVFRNWYSDRIECGLGICCESACSLILTGTEEFRLVILDDDGEPCVPDPEDREFFSIRNHVFEIASRRDIPIYDRVCEIESFLGLSRPDIHCLADYMKSLEMLDSSWGKLLDSVHTDNIYNDSLELPLENLFNYLIYRHSCSGFSFPVAMWHLIRCICLSDTDSDIFEISRMWSSEIEYSDINPELIADYLYRECQI